MITKGIFSRYAAGLWLAGVLGVAACGGASSSASMASGATPAARASASVSATSASASTTADTIVIKNFMFSPSRLTVAPGTVVTVRNEDSVTHTVTDQADAKLFGTGNVSPGKTMTFKAPAKAGSYPFICTIHQYMTGTLVVR